LRIWNKA